MKIIYSPRFEREAVAAYEFIAKDKIKAAQEFLIHLKKQIEGLVNHPKKGRLNDEGYRELIYKGYTVPYLLDGEYIVILGLFNQNNWEFNSPNDH